MLSSELIIRGSLPIIGTLDFVIIDNSFLENRKFAGFFDQIKNSLKNMHIDFKTVPHDEIKYYAYHYYKQNLEGGTLHGF